MSECVTHDKQDHTQNLFLEQTSVDLPCAVFVQDAGIIKMKKIKLLSLSSSQSRMDNFEKKISKRVV